MNETAFLEALARYAPEVQRAFIAAVQDVTDNAVLARVVEALEKGDTDAAWRALGVQQSVFNRFVSGLTAVFDQHAATIMASIPARTQQGVKMRFDIRDPEAERWLREQSGTLITNVTNDMRETVRLTAAEGAAQGRNPRSTALDIIGRINTSTGHREGGTIGLTLQQEEWSRSVRARLVGLDEAYFTMELRDKRFDRTVADAIEQQKPLPADTVQKLVDRYRAKALLHRGEQIARTETLSAMNRSEYESVRQAMAQSDFPFEATTKVWKTASDNRVRHTHAALHNQRKRFDEPFETPQGNRMMHPGDTSLGAPASEIIACRCRVSYDTNWLYGLE